MELQISDLNCMNMTLGSLEHHGVPGMKWGVRKARPSSSGSRKGRSMRQKPRKGHASKKAKTGRIKVENLSDKELRKRINRLQMEVQYKKLNTNKSGVKTFVNNILQEVAKDVVKSRVTNTVNKGIDTGINSAKNQIKKYLR